MATAVISCLLPLSCHSLCVKWEWRSPGSVIITLTHLLIISFSTERNICSGFPSTHRQLPVGSIAVSCAQHCSFSSFSPVLLVLCFLGSSPPSLPSGAPHAPPRTVSSQPLSHHPSFLLLHLYSAICHHHFPPEHAINLFFFAMSSMSETVLWSDCH